MNSLKFFFKHLSYLVVGLLAAVVITAVCIGIVWLVSTALSVSVLGKAALVLGGISIPFLLWKMGQELIEG